MSKFCTSCGAMLPDMANNCPSCGAPVAQDVTPTPQDVNQQENQAENAAPVEQEAPIETTVEAPVTEIAPEPVASQEPQPVPVATQPAKDKNSLIGMVAVGVIALIVILFIANLLGGGYKAPIKNMVKGMEKSNWKTFSKSMPEPMVDQMNSYFKLAGIKNGDKFMDQMLDDLTSEYGKNFKMDVDFKDKKSLKKSEIKSLEDDFKATYNKKIDIKKGYEVECEMTIKGKKDKSTDETTFTVVKIGSKWYLLDSGFFF